jgi:hypothetical protein
VGAESNDSDIMPRMKTPTIRYLTIILGTVIALAVVSCSSAEPTAVPSATATTIPTSTVTPTTALIPTPGPSAWQVYTDSLGVEWVLLGQADIAVGDAWADFVESLEDSGPANPEIAVAVENALSIYVERSTAMQEKLKTVTPPPGCELVHILFSDVAGIGVESVQVMQEIVDDGSFTTETTKKMEVAMEQVNYVVADLEFAQAQGECR